MTEFADAWLADYDATPPVKVGPAAGTGRAGAVRVVGRRWRRCRPRAVGSRRRVRRAPSAGPAASATPGAPGSSSSGAPVVAIVFLLGAVVIVVAIAGRAPSPGRRRHDA